jgi:hypothetical protein
MGCGSSSLKGSDTVGTDAPKPVAVAPAESSTPMNKVRTNFSNIDYDAPAETHKGSLLKARAPDELDEGPSRNASVAVAGAGNLQGETKDGILEQEHPAEKNALEPYHKNPDISSEPKTTAEETQVGGGKTPDFIQ